MAFSRDGRLVQTNGEKGVLFWDASTGNEVKLVHDRENRYQRVAFSPIEDKFAGLRNGGLEVRSIASGDLISKIDAGGASMRHFDFSPDGKLVVAGLQDKTARAWSASTGRPVLTLMGHDDVVEQASVSPDGKLIVTSSLDRTVRVWDAETETEIAILRGPDNADESKFSLNGRLVVSISNNLVQVWRIFGSVQELINQACNVAPRFLSSKQRGSFAVNVSSVGTACQK
jgi:WD40 repeat protein